MVLRVWRVGDPTMRIVTTSTVNQITVEADSHYTIMADYVTRRSANSRLPPEVNRILYVRNLPFKISAEELYAIFGKYGAVYQIRLGSKDKDTRGTAFVVYEDIYDAKAAVDHLSGFNVGGRYLVVLYYQPAKFQKRAEAEEKQQELEELRRRVKQQKQKQPN